MFKRTLRFHFAVLLPSAILNASQVYNGRPISTEYCFETTELDTNSIWQLHNWQTARKKWCF